MAEHTFKLPDIGEGIAEAELATWLIKVGDVVQEDDPICEVTTDKATVEIPASASGTVTWVGGAPGDKLAIGSDLLRIETDSDAPVRDKEKAAVSPPAKAADSGPQPKNQLESDPTARPTRPAPPSAQIASTGASGRPLAAPSVRGKARELGIDLRRIRGTGPACRILHEDLEEYIVHGRAPAPGTKMMVRSGVEDVAVTGVRRAISDRMSEAKRHIPHFSIIEEVEVEALENLRATLNAQFGADRAKLTLLPFLVRAISEAILDHPEVNALYDDEVGVIHRHAALHAGIATQTEQGLMVPVLRHAEAMNLWDSANEIRRLSDAARSRKSTPKDLSGSSITITSLGPLGAVATTPIINRPEVAIVGVNKMMIRPIWNGTDFVPRRMMNLSCSFDHRVVDGWVAAEFVAKLKRLLEEPAMLFMEWRDE